VSVGRVSELGEFRVKKIFAWGAVWLLGLALPLGSVEYSIHQVNEHLNEVDQSYFRKVEAFTKERLPQVNLAALPAAWGMLSIDQICKVPEMRRVFGAARDCSFIPKLREMTQAREFLLGFHGLGGGFALLWCLGSVILRKRGMALSKNGSVEGWITQAFSVFFSLTALVLLFSSYRLLGMHSEHLGLAFVEARLALLSGAVLLPMGLSVGLGRLLPGA